MGRSIVIVAHSKHLFCEKKTSVIVIVDATETSFSFSEIGRSMVIFARNMNEIFCFLSVGRCPRTRTRDFFWFFQSPWWSSANANARFFFSIAAVVVRERERRGWFFFRKWEYCRAVHRNFSRFKNPDKKKFPLIYRRWRWWKFNATPFAAHKRGPAKRFISNPRK